MNIRKNYLLILLFVGTFTGCEKYALDRQMEELCKKDGGVKVYETVELPPEMFDPYGNPFWRYTARQEDGTPFNNFYFQTRNPENILGPEYRYISKIEEIVEGDPLNGEGELRRFHIQIIQNSDKKILGESVSYGRSGGDFIAYAHPSSKSCPSSQSDSDVIRKIFIKQVK